MEGGVNKADFSGQMFQNLVKVTLDTNVINSSISYDFHIYRIVLQTAFLISSVLTFQLSNNLNIIIGYKHQFIIHCLIS